MARDRDPLVIGRVIGEVLDSFTIPHLYCLYMNRKLATGASLKPSQIRNQPRVMKIGGDDMLIEALRLVTNIPATTGAWFGQEIVCYESPRPSIGIHRMVFVLFRQLCRQTVYAPGWRQNFNTRGFAELYNLGSPVAAVYFNCQRENGSGGRRR
ncbi:flowering locus T-like protein [Tanacetum coccineum]